MKTSLAYLPADKQQQILEITNVIKEVANPEKIILFGSYAKGNYVEHHYTARDGINYEYISDYDFLVVTEVNTVKEYELEDKVNSRTSKTRPDINIQLHTVQYVNEGLEFEQYFFTDIVKEGILLYDSGKVQFPEPRELTAQEIKDIAIRYFNMWFERASGFLKVAIFCLNSSELRIGAFNLHQSTESFFNTVLLVFTGYKPKTHNLYKLRKYSKGLSEQLFLTFPIEFDKHQQHLFDLLKRGYIDARYKSDYEIKNNELEELIRIVEEMKNIVESLCKNYIQQLTAS